MRNLPKNPHAIVEISGLGILDSWENPRLIKRVGVELTTNQSAQATWEFFDPKFRLIDSFAGAGGVPMMTARLFLGYGRDLSEPIFKGIVTQIERGQSSTAFTAYDMGFKMKLVKKAGYKNKKDDLQILKELAARNGLQFEGPEKPLKLEPHKAMMQDEQTDWEHAMERARDAGLVIFVRQDTLFAKYPAKVGSPTLTLINKKDFVLQSDWDFTYRTPENQDGRPRKVTVRGRGKGGKRIEGVSDISERGTENVILKRDGKATKTKLTQRAQAQRELDREHAFEARVKAVFPLDGERLDVRNTVEILEVGKLFSGKYLADKVSYDFSPGELGVNLDLYRDING